MKKIAVVILLSFISVSFAFTQEETDIVIVENENVIDTLARNSIGLNVFPAVGMLGGGSLDNTKIYIQYKRYFEKINLRANLNLITFHRPVDKVDLFSITQDTLSTDGGVVLNDTLRYTFRKTNSDAFAYDARFGVERVFPHNNFRFHIGAAAIIGYQYVGDFYYHYDKRSATLPVEWVNISRLIPEERGYFKNNYLKTGLDFSLGVDISISPNVVFTLQLTPEIAYFKHMSFDKNDPDNYYTEPGSDKLVFTPDYIDFIISIRF